MLLPMNPAPPVTMIRSLPTFIRTFYFDGVSRFRLRGDFLLRDVSPRSKSHSFSQHFSKLQHSACGL